MYEDKTLESWAVNQRAKDLVVEEWWLREGMMI